MANPELQVYELLNKHGYRLIRESRHLIFRSQTLNAQIVFPSTGSDKRGWANALTDLRRQIAGQPTRGTAVRFTMTPELSRAFDRSLGKTEIKPSGGVQRPAKTRGTGFVYDPAVKVLTAEEEAARKAESERIRAAQAEKRARRDERRVRDQKERDARRAAKEAYEAEREAVVLNGRLLVGCLRCRWRVIL